MLKPRILSIMTAAIISFVAALTGSPAVAAPRAEVRFLPLEPPSAAVPDGAHPDGGPCVQTFSTYSSFVGGGNATVQAGLVETEIVAASYVLTAADFPLRLDQAQAVWGTINATIATTTKWSLLVWQGIPSTGTVVIAVSSDGISIPHIVLPSGTSATLVQVDFLPDPPDHIVIQDDGTHTFSIGFRIDDHQQQTGNPCTVAPPPCCNAFPTTDASGVSNLANNWLFGINCGAFGCPANGGWARFSTLPGFCRPSSDWNLWATYLPSYALVEIVTLTCDDGLDNDCDGFADCDDSDCAAEPICALTASPTIAGGGAALALEVTNPARRTTAPMRLHVPRPALVRIDVIDLQGRVAATIPVRAYSSGVHELSWNGGTLSTLASGTYFVRAEAEGIGAVTEKIVVVR